MSKKVLKLLRGDQGEPERTCDITNLVSDIPDMDYLKKNKKNMDYNGQRQTMELGQLVRCSLLYASAFEAATIHALFN